MTKDQGAAVTRLDAIRDAADKAELTVVERPDGDLLLKAAEADLLNDVVGDYEDDPGSAATVDALEDLGRLRRRNLERFVTAGVAEVRGELRRDLVDFMALNASPDERLDTVADLSPEDGLTYARTVRDLADAYRTLGGELDLAPSPTLGLGIQPAAGPTLYTGAEIVGVISALPGLENATTIADDVLTRLMAAREDGVL